MFIICDSRTINQLNFNPTYVYEKTLPKIEFDIIFIGDVCLIGARTGTYGLRASYR